MRYIPLYVLIVLFSFVNAYAQEFYYIPNYRVEIKVLKDGSLDITETIQAQFTEPRHGLLVDKPLKYKVDTRTSGEWLDQLFPHELFIENIRVEQHNFEVQRMGTGIRIKIGDADKYVEGQQIYKIHYKIWNGLLHGNGKTELYWNLIGDHWNSDIRKLDFKIEIPKGINLTSSDYEIRTGTYGAREQAGVINYNNGVFEGYSTETLGNGKAMTVAIRMPEGIIQTYSKTSLWFYHFKYVLLPLMMLVSFFYSWWKHGRDTKLADMVAYMPPKDMDSALAGYAIDIRSDKRDALSLIPYFGSLGYLKIEHLKKKGFFEEDQITFIKLKPLPANAAPHQRMFFEGLFASRDRVTLESLKDSFYVTLQNTLQSIKDSVLNSDYFTRKSVSIYWTAIWSIILSAILNAVFCFFAGRFVFLGLTILLALVLILIAFILLKRSQKGDEEFKEIKGFKKFIKLAEKSKLEFLIKEDPSYFDKTLPYAIAFNCVDEWCDKFNGIQMQAPTWYSSNVPFYNSSGVWNMSNFSETMSSSLSEMRSVMSSQPSSSGSSSGGGGSFSGGGFGGGGGSSW
ncbi:MAG: DUF2207 domain-containing protein [Saprospiraceae bacterium]|jgi:uncharacterized membrane protein YgcG